MGPGRRIPGLLAIACAIAAPSLTATRAAADSLVTTGTPDRNYVNMRIGSSSGDPEGHPSLCIEVSPLAAISLESCGTGSGILHDSKAPELAHFRGKVRLASIRTERAWLQPQLALGFAELQVGEDRSGFDFSGVGPDHTDTSGPELGASLKILVPVGRDFELIGDLGAGVAWLPHAPQLARPGDEYQFSASITAGFGF